MHSKPKILIFSSKESLEITNNLKELLNDDGFSSFSWNGVFMDRTSHLNSLYKIYLEYDAFIFVCAGDDCTLSRNRELITPRDNVIFELGYFMGLLGQEDASIFLQEGVKLPTDLEGHETFVFNVDEEKRPIISDECLAALKIKL